jgi:hypothetical protein
MAELNTDGATGPKYTTPQAQGKLQWLRGRWSVFDSLTNNSGFGFDTELNVQTAADDVWTEYIAAHNGAVEFHHRPLPLYTEMSEIFRRDPATGRYIVLSTEGIADGRRVWCRGLRLQFHQLQLGLVGHDW